MKQVYMRETIDLIFKSQGQQAVQNLINEGEMKVLNDGAIVYLLIDHKKKEELIQRVLDRK